MKIQLEDFLMHYEEKGDGEPLVLLHGNGEDLGYFAGQMEYFRETYRVIALDTRGHGESERGTAPFTLEQFGRDLYDCLRKMETGPVHLLGFSDGGNIALAFGREHPEMVRSLILNGANLDPWGVKLSVQLPIVAGYGMVSLLAPFLRDCRRKKEILGLMVREPHYEKADLEALTMPVLVIAGDRDMIRESHTRRIAREIKGSRLIILPGSHFLAKENKEAFNRAVEAFLDEVRAKEAEDCGQRKDG
ncbi:MAG: alpha/beta hydrolase [Lachnospiraceae bacterium]|uniref:Alpha/beta hydrolase n=1 Tax=Candidatus Enterocloster excrementigallinarum TaxID=2838558 RepID=A0A9D2PWM8_9FIRM|nr:alpha/beta hydrolase [Lachnospiraceae bacterium]HJC66600.1 alpha/beta hydrolase [Candidatus Enterocloster excrementigallinarum]